MWLRIVKKYLNSYDKETKTNFGYGNTALRRSRQEDHKSEASQDSRVRECLKQNNFNNNDITTVNPPTFIP